MSGPVEDLDAEWELTEFPDERTAMIMRADLRYALKCQRDIDASVRDAALEEAAQAIEAEMSGIATYRNTLLRQVSAIVRDLKGNPQ